MLHSPTVHPSLDAVRLLGYQPQETNHEPPLNYGEGGEGTVENTILTKKHNAKTRLDLPRGHTESVLTQLWSKRILD